jgi:hypothetical protein
VTRSSPGDGTLTCMPKISLSSQEEDNGKIGERPMTKGNEGTRFSFGRYLPASLPFRWACFDATLAPKPESECMASPVVDETSIDIQEKRDSRQSSAHSFMRVTKWSLYGALLTTYVENKNIRRQLRVNLSEGAIPTKYQWSS